MRSVALAAGDEAVAVGEGGGDGLFAEDVLARREGGGDVVGVGAVWCGDDDGIYLIQQLLRGGAYACIGQ